MQVVLLERPIHFLSRTRQPRQNPSICERQIHLPDLGKRRNAIFVLDVPQAESRGVPDLCCEITVAFEEVVRDRKVRSRSTHTRHSKSHGVSSELVAELEWIHHVTLR